jgi:hypothetical protein
MHTFGEWKPQTHIPFPAFHVQSPSPQDNHLLPTKKSISPLSTLEFFLRTRDLAGVRVVYQSTSSVVLLPIDIHLTIRRLLLPLRDFEILVGELEELPILYRNTVRAEG